MSNGLSRELLDAVFAPGELVTVPGSVLGPVSDGDAREVLATLGLPVWQNSWFELDDGLEPRTPAWSTACHRTARSTS